MDIPELERSQRIREYKNYTFEEISRLVKQWLFIGDLGHRELDSEILGLDSVYSKGFQSMGVLHYLGLRQSFKGIFRERELSSVINELRNNSQDFADIIGYLESEDQALEMEQYPPSFDLFEEEAERDGAFDPDGIEDALSRVYRAIIQRRGQTRFRNNLMVVYQGKCAATEFDSPFALEACHIMPYHENGPNHVTNGLLLRADIHTLFDLGKMSVDTSDMTWILSDSLRGSSYADIFGRPLRQPEDPEHRPSIIALEHQRIRSGL